jgi:hypothetical protein
VDGNNDNKIGGNGDGKNDPRRGLKTISVDPVEGLEPLAEFPASERVFLHESGDGHDAHRGTFGFPFVAFTSVRANRPWTCTTRLGLGPPIRTRACPSSVNPGLIGGSRAEI